MADGPQNLLGAHRPVLDFQGAPTDDRTWIMREKVLADDVGALRQEVMFLREMLRLALEHNTERKP